MIHLPPIPSIDHDAEAQMRLHVDRLTKPQGSLGRLEEIAVRLAGITGVTPLTVARKTVVTMAADHGVAEEGVSAFPQAVTVQMVRNFLREGAAVNVFARQMGARVVVVDLGVAGELPDHPGLIKKPVARGTKNFLRGPAMTRAEAEQAVTAGLDVAAQVSREGADVIALGEMGIGNTTSASAIVGALSGRSVNDVIGRGTGVSDEGMARKSMVIQQALALHRPNPKDGWDVLSKVGGFEIGGLAGVVIGAASRRMPVMVDGFISTAAAWVAAVLQPDVKPYLFSGHQSVERGQRVALEALGLQPLLDLSMRLGEGTGAVLAMSFLDAAVNMANHMATFESAHVDQRSADQPITSQTPRPPVT